MDNRLDPDNRTTATSDRLRTGARRSGSSGLIVGIVLALLIAGAIAWFAGLFDSRSTTTATNTRPGVTTTTTPPAATTPPAGTTAAPGTTAPTPPATTTLAPAGAPPARSTP